MLDAKQHQGKFGEDYVRVLASAAGLVVFKEDIDVNGVDLGFRATGRYGRVFSPMIEAQVKTWSKPTGSAGRLHYRGLDEWQFNQLAGSDFSVPRYLFLICVPARSADYAASRPEGMLLRHLGYYVSLRAEQQIPEPDRRRIRPVVVPMANVLTTQALRRLTESPTDW
jgi:Domain of unknown function (DUF4365)